MSGEKQLRLQRFDMILMINKHFSSFHLYNCANFIIINT
jgi:hypothetical protein